MVLRPAFRRKDRRLRRNQPGGRANDGKNQLGTRLLGFRIEKLGSLGGIRRITVRTSQLAFGFYRKQGFVLKEVKKDYWAEGFDLYAMEYGGWK